MTPPDEPHRDPDEFVGSTDPTSGADAGSGPGSAAGPDPSSGSEEETWERVEDMLEEGAPLTPQDESTGAVPASIEVQLAERTADLQRLQAEYLNYKRRVDRDRDLVRENASYSVLSAMLPVLDNIDRAREHDELHGGFKAVAESLERVVSGLGLTKYGAQGDEFDPNLHEALMHGHSSEVTTTVCDQIAEAGYRIGDRVVRAAKVTVLDPE